MYSQDTPYNHISVVDDNGVRTLRFQHARQSSMYVDDPFETDFEYPAYLHLALAVQPAASRVLVIGLGGGTVVKRMWRDYPWMHLDVVEIDRGVVEVARHLFELPDDPRIRVIVGDGRHYLETTSTSYDIIIIDAFDDDEVPMPFVTEECMRHARDRLTAGGVIAYNYIGMVHGDRSKPLRSLHRTASNVWGRIWLFPCRMVDRPDPGPNDNVIMLATDHSVSTEELLARIADRVGGRVSVAGFERFGEDLHVGPIRTGDVPLFLDPRSRRVRHRARRQPR